MKRVAIFGNVGGGKSTLARELADITGLPLYGLDKLHGEVPYEEYLKRIRYWSSATNGLWKVLAVSSQFGKRLKQQIR